MSGTYDNKGFKIIGEPPEDFMGRSREVIVLGVGRGGTSAIAGMLHELGVFTGTGAQAPLYEDMTLANAVLSEDVEKGLSVMKEYSQDHAVWAFKHGSMFHRIADYHPRMVNPLYIIVFRDLAAIASRSEVSADVDFVKVLKQQYDLYGKLISFINNSSPYCMVVSYEKFILFPEPIIQAVCDFIGLSADAGNLESATRFVQPSPTEYVRTARSSGPMGKIDCVIDGKLLGWARPKLHRGDHVLQVELLIDGNVHSSCPANLYREGLEAVKKDGKCAFEFEIPDDAMGSELRVRVVGDEFDLDNSPLRV